MLFNKLIITRIRSTALEVKVTTGLMYGHKILQIGNYRFIELDDNCVVVEGEGFHAKCTNWEQLEFLFNAIR